MNDKVFECASEPGLPQSPVARKQTPVFSGVQKYFPDALQFVDDINLSSVASNTLNDASVALRNYACAGGSTWLVAALEAVCTQLTLSLGEYVEYSDDGADVDGCLELRHSHAVAEIAKVSFIGNEQHNPGQPLHWARGKSTDQLDAALRHIMEANAGTMRDERGNHVLAQAAWRILAQLQLDIEATNKETK